MSYMLINPTELLRLKEQANGKYHNDDYITAIKWYSQITDAYSPETVSVDLIRTVLANRAACYLAKSEYDKSIEDCLRVLNEFPQSKTTTRPSPIFAKCLYRLARSYYHLGRHTEALEQLALFRARKGPPEIEVALRMPMIMEAQAGPRPQAPQLKPFKYTVRVIGAIGELHPPVTYEELASPEMCSAYPPWWQLENLMDLIVRKHHDKIMALRPWICWCCPKRATSILHNPVSWLDQPEPEVVSFSLPICEKWGKCDREGMQFVKEEMALVEKIRWVSVGIVDMACHFLCGQDRT